MSSRPRCASNSKQARPDAVPDRPRTIPLADACGIVTLNRFVGGVAVSTDMLAAANVLRTRPLATSRSSGVQRRTRRRGAALANGRCGWGALVREGRQVTGGSTSGSSRAAEMIRVWRPNPRPNGSPAVTHFVARTSTIGSGAGDGLHFPTSLAVGRGAGGPEQRYQQTRHQKANSGRVHRPARCRRGTVCRAIRGSGWPMARSGCPPARGGGRFAVALRRPPAAIVARPSVRASTTTSVRG